MFSVTELFELNFGILSFFTILEKKLFKVSAVLDSDVSIFLFSFRFTFSLDTDLQASDLFKIVHWIEKLPPLHHRHYKPSHAIRKVIMSHQRSEL